MSNTPRTDEFIDSCGDYEKWNSYRDRLHGFTRTLELETVSLKQERDELVNALHVAADYLPDLIGAWAWKEGEIAGNAKEYEDLVNAEKAARAILSRYPEEP